MLGSLPSLHALLTEQDLYDSFGVNNEDELNDLLGTNFDGPKLVDALNDTGLTADELAVIGGIFAGGGLNLNDMLSMVAGAGFLFSMFGHSMDAVIYLNDLSKASRILSGATGAYLSSSTGLAQPHPKSHIGQWPAIEAEYPGIGLVFYNKNSLKEDIRGAVSPKTFTEFGLERLVDTVSNYPGPIVALPALPALGSLSLRFGGAGFPFDFGVRFSLLPTLLVPAINAMDLHLDQNTTIKFQYATIGADFRHVILEDKAGQPGVSVGVAYTFNNLGFAVNSLLPANGYIERMYTRFNFNSHVFNASATVSKDFGRWMPYAGANVGIAVTSLRIRVAGDISSEFANSLVNDIGTSPEMAAFIEAIFRRIVGAGSNGVFVQNFTPVTVSAMLANLYAGISVKIKSIYWDNRLSFNLDDLSLGLYSGVKMFF